MNTPSRQEHTKRPDSGHPLPVQSTATVQTLDALIPAKVQQASRAAQASSAGHLYQKSEKKTQLHSLLHINFLWLPTSKKHA